MSVVDRRGVKVVVARARKAGVVEIEKSRDLAIIRLRAAGQSWRQVGLYLGLSHEGARKRWRGIPEQVRRHYGKPLTLGGLEASGAGAT